MYLRRTNRLVLVMAMVSMSLLTAAVQSLAQSIKYLPSHEDFANPERGLFQYDDDRKGEKEPLVKEDLISKRKNNQTVVYRHYTLVKFQKSPLDASYLAFLNEDASIARKAGVKMIVRFAYEEQSGKKCAPNNQGASKQQVLGHLDQLADYFKVNSDVIVLLEAGFIGTYGEWYYGNNDFGYCETPKYAARADVVWRLLELLPANRMIALRAAYYKRGVIAEWVKAGKDGATISVFAKRIGYHNDGFLADGTDLGTFQDNSDRVMMAQDTATMPMVGETSINGLNPNPNPYAVWEKAKQASKTYHWSLISGTDDALIFTKRFICAKGNEWYQWTGEPECDKKTLVDRWTEDQRIEFRKNLGYRFVLVDGTYPDKAKPGQEIEITLNLKNEGWASPFNQRPVYLVLRNLLANKTTELELKDVDLRNWLPQVTTPIKTKVLLPAASGDFPAGKYDLFLYLPDAVLNTKYCALQGCNSADYAVRFGNKDIWELSNGQPTGYNKLGFQLIVE